MAWRRRSFFSLLGLASILFFIGSATLPLATGLIALADRYLYQSLWAAGLLTAMLTARFANFPQVYPARLWSYGLITAIVLVGLTLRQSAYWLQGNLLWVRVLELDPKNEYAGYFVGDYREKRGEYDEAIEALRPVVFSETGVTFQMRYAAAIKLGKIYFLQERLDDALRAYDKALISPKFYACARVGQAVVEFTRGQRRPVLEVLAEFEGQQDLDPNVCLDLARLALRSQAKLASARDWYRIARQKGVEMDPDLENALASDNPSIGNL